MTRTFMSAPLFERESRRRVEGCPPPLCSRLRAAQSRREGQKVAGLDIGPVGRLLVGETVSVDVGAAISRGARAHHVEPVGRYPQELTCLCLQHARRLAVHVA